MAELVLAWVGITGAAIGLVAYRKRRESLAADVQLPMTVEGDLGPYENFNGRVVMVTGANTGVGYAAATALAKHGADVVVVCRSVAKAADAAERINRKMEGVDGAGTAEPAPAALDLASMQSVRDFAYAYIATGKQLHVLVNNAGAQYRKRELVDIHATAPLPPMTITTTRDRDTHTPHTHTHTHTTAHTHTRIGAHDAAGHTPVLVERTMVVNHLGPWLLTRLLMPVLQETGRRDGKPARVIFVSSRLEKNGAKPLSAWLNEYTWKEAEDEEGCAVRWSRWNAYSASKLANLLVVAELDRHYHGLYDIEPDNRHVTASACTPGMVQTELGRWACWPLRCVTWPLRRMLLKGPEEGARPILFLAGSQRLQGVSGGFWGLVKGQIAELEPSMPARDAILAHRVWTTAKELLHPWLKGTRDY